MLRDIDESIHSLMADFVVESLSNTQSSGTAEFGLRASEDFNIANFQEQVGMFLLHGKKFLLCDIAEPFSMAGKVSAAVKQRIYEGVKNGAFANNNCMKHFLNLSEMGLLSSHVAMLTLHSNLKDFDLESNRDEAMRKALDPESVSIPMAFYVFLICIANPQYSPSDFNKIFANSWVEYYNSFMVKFMMIRMNGPKWKTQFKGCLFDN